MTVVASATRAARALKPPVGSLRLMASVRLNHSMLVSSAQHAPSSSSGRAPPRQSKADA
jgi:hypothetical protein